MERRGEDRREIERKGHKRKLADADVDAHRSSKKQSTDVDGSRGLSRSEVRGHIDVLKRCVSSSKADRSAAWRAARTLGEIAMQEENIGLLVEEGAAGVLVKHLQAPSSVEADGSIPYEYEVEKEAAFAVGLLAGKPEHQRLLIEAGALRPLVSLLQKKVNETNTRMVNGAVRRAADAVSKLARDNKSVQSRLRQALGLKSNKKRDDNLEAYYEKRAKLVSKVKDEDTQGSLFDPANVLPVKTLTGELHYHNARSKPKLEVEGKEEGLNLEERKVLVRMKTPTNTSQPSLLIDDVPGQANSVALKVEGKKKLPKVELRKEQKKAKKESQSLSNGRSALKQESHTSSHFSALEELKQDLSEEERVEEMKARMAELGTAVIADPENNLDSLTELQVLCGDKNANITRMAMLSLLAVYKDIIPGYRIRLPTQKELEMQVSKEVKKLWDFETKLLKCYQKYVQILIESVKSVSLWRPASRCVCGLLEAIPHFNFRDSLLSVTIPLMDSANPDCRTMSCSAVKSLFQNEGKHGGSATVEAVELIADLVKTEKCIVRPDVIQVLLSLSFDENLNRPASEQEKEKGRESRVENHNAKHQEKDKKAKKRQLAAKFREEVVADFRKSCALPEAGEIRRLQTQTLSAVFETFFRVLKSSSNPLTSVHDTNSVSTRSKLKEYGPRPLLRPCLDGLAKFSHLISVDFMGDLLAILKRLAAGIPETPGGEAQNLIPLSFTDRIHCCVVAFKIVRSNLDALNIDLRAFYVSLYNLLLCHNFMRDENEGLVLAEALQVMLWESRQHDMQRVAAFIKRLAAESLHLGSGEVISALVTVRHLLQRYKKCCNLLENDDGGGVVGHLAVLEGEGADPDLSGALSSVLWEVSLLSRHYHPDVAQIANQISNMVTSSEVLQAVLTPKEAIAVYSTTKGGFNPSIQLPKKIANKKSYLSHYRLQPKAVVLNDDSLDPAFTNCGKETNEIFLSHFKVLRDIKENEALRSQLNRAIRSIELCKMFKAKKKQTPLSTQKLLQLKS